MRGTVAKKIRRAARSIADNDNRLYHREEKGMTINQAVRKPYAYTSLCKRIKKAYVVIKRRMASVGHETKVDTVVYLAFRASNYDNRESQPA